MNLIKSEHIVPTFVRVQLSSCESVQCVIHKASCSVCSSLVIVKQSLVTSHS